MPRPRRPKLNRAVTRHGRVVWYMRVGQGAQRRRVRIRAEYGTPEFEAECEAAIAGGQTNFETRRMCSAGTIGWLIDRYRDTATWANLSPATKRQRDYFFRAAPADMPLSKVTRDVIIAGRDRRSATPSQARHFLMTVRTLFRWAIAARHVEFDPTEGVAKIPEKHTGGFPIWTDEDVERYALRWPIGTRQRVWLDVLLYTGLRRGDAMLLGRQHVRAGVATMLTEKTGTEVMLPILPILQATLDAGPCGDLTFIVGQTGQPFTNKEAFGNAFRQACRAAGVPGSAHGLRKAAATRAANNGATVAQLKAIFGWSTDSMAGHYTRAADRRHLAREAMHKLMER